LQGWGRSVPFVVIIVVLMVRGRALPLRSEASDRPPAVGRGRVRPAFVLPLAAFGIAIIAFGLPTNGVEAATTTATTAIVVLSMHDATSQVAQALEAGAHGYVVKDAGAPELLEALRLALEGRRYVSPPLSAQAVIEEARRTRAKEPDPYDALTPRERAVLQMASEGLTSKDIGEELGISHRTAETHRARLMKKLGLRDRTALVRFAIQHGILSSDDGEATSK